MLRFITKKPVAKLLVAAAILIILSFSLAPHISLAADPAPAGTTDKLNLTDCISLSPLQMATCGIRILAIVINALAGLLIALGAWMLTMVIQWNKHILTLDSVQKGFAISLAVANLGFVLGIVILALATILRNQTYGIKQFLWKLVVAAIIVNFGLSIAGTIMVFSDNLSVYFLNGFQGSLENPAQFVNTLTGKFQVQALVAPPSSGSGGSDGTSAAICGAIGGIYGSGAGGLCQIIDAANNKVASFFVGDGSQLNNFIVAVLGILFVIIFNFLIAFTLLAIGIMFLIRFVIMGILLIILPLAWLTWIFPKFSGNWTRWWSEFIRWAFFPPITLFFLYLAMLTSPPAAGVVSTGGVNSPIAAVGILTGNSGAIAAAFNAIFTIALALGGLFAANKLAITGSGAAMGMLKGIGGAVQGYVGKQTKKGARLAYQKAGGKEMEKALREGRIGPLAGVPGAKRLASIFGRGLGGVSTNEAMVEEAKRNVPKSWDEAKSNLKGSMNTEDNFAHIALGVKEGKIKMGDMVGNTTAKEYMDQMFENGGIARFKQEKLYDDFNKLAGSDKNERDSAKELEKEREAVEKIRNESYERNRSEAMSQGYSPQEAEAQATVAAEREANEYLNKKVRVKVAKDVKDESGNYLKDDDGNEFKKGSLVSAIRLLEASQKQFWEKFSKTDASRVDVNSVFGPSAFTLERLRETERRIKNIAQYAPQVVPNLVKKMNSSTLNAFQENYSKLIQSLLKENKKLRDSLRGDPARAAEFEKAEAAVKRWAKINNSFSRTVSNYYGSADASQQEEKFEGGGGQQASEKKT